MIRVTAASAPGVFGLNAKVLTSKMFLSSCSTVVLRTNTKYVLNNVPIYRHIVRSCHTLLLLRKFIFLEKNVQRLNDIKMFGQKNVCFGKIKILNMY